MLSLNKSDKILEQVSKNDLKSLLALAYRSFSNLTSCLCLHPSAHSQYTVQATLLPSILVFLFLLLLNKHVISCFWNTLSLSVLLLLLPTG